MKKLAVLTSGGDSPGMNAALRAVASVFAQKAPDLEAIANDLVAVRYFDATIYTSKVPLTPSCILHRRPARKTILNFRSPHSKSAPSVLIKPLDWLVQKALDFSWPARRKCMAILSSTLNPRPIGATSTPLARAASTMKRNGLPKP